MSDDLLNPDFVPDNRCDWCDREAVHRHVDSVEEVRACAEHHPAYLLYLQRVRVLDARAGVTR